MMLLFPFAYCPWVRRNCDKAAAMVGFRKTDRGALLRLTHVQRSRHLSVQRIGT
jgi:hypothetical protein